MHSVSDQDQVVMEQLENSVRLITINRPSKYNALDLATYTALSKCIDEADADQNVQVIILTGAGGNFTAGNDLADFQSSGESEGPKGSDERGGRILLKSLMAVRKPIIAAVEGHAVGIGTTMLLHCDMAVAGEGARFKMPFTSLALTPEAGSTYLLPRMAGYKVASELFMLGDEFDAQRAVEVGIANRAVPKGSALDNATELANALANRPREAVQATKALMRQMRETEVATAIERETVVFNERLNSEEAQEIFRQFTEKN